MPASAPERIVVVGASAAGLKAASRARRLLPGARITVLDERRVFSYAACGLPFFLSGEIETLAPLRQTGWGAVRDEAFFARAKGIEILSGVRAIGLDPDRRVVMAANLGEGSGHGARRAGGGQGGGEPPGERLEVAYDRLVIATGAAPVVPPGIELGGPVGTFHTTEDALALREDLQAGRAGSVVIIGGGFVGCEVAVALRDLWGCETTILEAAAGPLPRLLDPEMGAVVAQALARGGVDFVPGAAVGAVRAEGGAAVIEAAGRAWRADRAVVAVGVRPRVGWAAASGLRLGPLGGVAVDPSLRTSLPDVWAAGDCAEILHAVTGRTCLLPLGSLANRQGRVVAEQLAGGAARFGPVAGCMAVRVFELDVAAAGLTEQEARGGDLEARAAWGTFNDLPHYQPGRGVLHLKLVHEDVTGRLLGIQAIGPGAVKRVDVAAQALRRGGDVADLLEVEHCYCPPYGPALDPLHGLAAIASNDVELGIGPVAPRSAPGERFVVDLRTAEEVAGRPPLAGALHIPLEELRSREGELPAGRPLLLVCAMGPRSWEAARYLAGRGWTDLAYLGGGLALRDAGGSP